MDIHREAGGYGKGDLILFIHGSGGSATMWRRQKEYLQTLIGVALIDLPGHGKSPGDGCDYVEEYCDVVHKAMEDFNPGRCYIAGHSLGGAIAMSLALTYPDAVKGTILIGTGAKLKVLPQILEGILKDKEGTIRDINNLSFSQGTPATIKDEAFDEIMRCRSEVIYKDFNACDHFNIIGSVDSIKVPTLVLCGEEDALTPVRYSQFLKEKIKDSQLALIKGAGHMVMMEKPDEVNKLIERFLKNHP
jgi:pimeloyl-ACP methyl ester carboxylesterase